MKIPEVVEYVVLEGDPCSQCKCEDADEDAGEDIVLRQVGHEVRPPSRGSIHVAKRHSSRLLGEEEEGCLGFQSSCASCLATAKAHVAVL